MCRRCLGPAAFLLGVEFTPALPPYDRQRLKEVFAGARALPASDRQAYVSAACAGNDALRQEMESLLAADERAKSFLECENLRRGFAGFIPADADGD
ncbi:MAG TPA: hypothetical protein VFO14_15530 [Vicinamibacterales bacterium]|nr:hypothetical protein [Vicinamibacterales bacterium]